MMVDPSFQIFAGGYFLYLLICLYTGAYKNLQEVKTHEEIQFLYKEALDSPPTIKF